MNIKRYNKEELISFLKNNGYNIGIKIRDKETKKIGILDITQHYYFYPVIRWIKKDGTTSIRNYKKISNSFDNERIIYSLKNYYEIIKED